MMIAARPTTYAGIPMRSRLEATVAEWMDSGGWEWQYEPRAYAAPGQRQYLPDFEIHKLNDDAPVPAPMFMEVRPTIEGAYRGMAQMPVIWSSDPRAILLITAWPVGLLWMATHGDKVWKLIAWSGDEFP